MAGERRIMMERAFVIPNWINAPRELRKVKLWNVLKSPTTSTWQLSLSRENMRLFSMRHNVTHSRVFSVMFSNSYPISQKCEHVTMKLKRVKLLTILLETPEYREKIEFRLPEFFRQNTKTNVSNRDVPFFTIERRLKTVHFFHFSQQNCYLLQAGWVWIVKFNLTWDIRGVLHWFHWQMRTCFICSGETAWPH